MRALITGAAGQDGTILSHMLHRDGAQIVGLVKPGTDTHLLRRYAPDIEIIEADLGETDELRRIAIDARPDQIFNLGGFTSPAESWEHEQETRHINVDAVAALLDAQAQLTGARLFQASSASIFEGVDRSPQTERMERIPKSPYGQSKAEAMKLVDAARDKGQFAVCGILYNHESPLRNDMFVTRKISKGVARIAAGLQDVIDLGDIEVARDWGWAPDYVRAMRLMLDADVPHDYVLATGISHRLSFFISKAFAAVGIDDWQDKVSAHSDRKHLADTNLLVGDSRAAYLELGWRHTIDFDHMAVAMVKHDVALLKDPDALWLDF